MIFKYSIFQHYRILYPYNIYNIYRICNIYNIYYIIFKIYKILNIFFSRSNFRNFQQEESGTFFFLPSTKEQLLFQQRQQTMFPPFVGSFQLFRKNRGKKRTLELLKFPQETGFHSKEKKRSAASPAGFLKGGRYYFWGNLP